jgi:hypothetical protein
MGIVYAALDDRLGRVVAVKTGAAVRPSMSSGVRIWMAEVQGKLSRDFS